MPLSLPVDSRTTRDRLQLFQLLSVAVGDEMHGSVSVSVGIQTRTRCRTQLVKFVNCELSDGGLKAEAQLLTGMDQKFFGEQYSARGLRM